MQQQAIKLGGLSFSQLVQLRENVQGALRDRLDAERQALKSKLAEIERLDQGLHSASGLSNPKLNGAHAAAAVQSVAKRASKGKKVAPKYRGPAGETWAGRGQTPRWLAVLEAQGFKRETYLIGSPN